MELELNRRSLPGFDPAVDTTLFAEETLECIVPDACPDVLRILDTHGLVCLKSKEAGEGRVELRGVIRTSVLYLPDGADGVRKVEVSIPFTCGTEAAGSHPGCPVMAHPRLLTADARMLNPRKLYIRAEIAIDLQVFVPSTLVYSAGAEQEEALGIQQRLESCRTYMVTVVQEKPFTFSDDLPLPGGKPDIEELLRQRAALFCTESKVIGNKLIFKGQALLTILYRGEDQSLYTALFELPFSQIMEISGGGEEADCTLELFLSDLVCQADGENRRSLSVSMGILAQAALREEREIELVSDLYSTTYKVECDGQEDGFRRLCESGCRRESIREALETPVGVKSVVDCWLAIGTVAQTWREAALTLSADVRATVLYIGEDDGLYALTRSVPAECQIEPEADCQCACRCTCTGELYATPSAGGLELRFPLDFLYRLEKRRTVREISAARLDREAPMDMAERPSVVVRRLESGEELWDIAKAYFTTVEEIMWANELADESATAGKLLLIPKRR